MIATSSPSSPLLKDEPFLGAKVNQTASEQNRRDIAVRQPLSGAH